MSIKLMTICWEIDLPPGEKLVLLALADQANDEGRQCWPSVETIAHRSGQGVRTVRRCLASLEEKGHLTRQHRDGASSQYHVHPCQIGTTAKSAPLPKTTATPAKLAPKPSGTIKGEEAKASPPKRAPKIDPFPKPDWAEDQVWSDWLEVRRKKDARNTATAHAGFLTDIANLTNDEWPPGRLLKHAVQKSWAGIYEPKEGYPTSGRRDAPQRSGFTQQRSTRELGMEVARELEANANRDRGPADNLPRIGPPGRVYG